MDFIVLAFLMAFFLCAHYFVLDRRMRKKDEDLSTKMQTVLDDLQKTFDEKYNNTIEKKLTEIFNCDNIISAKIKDIDLSLANKFKELTNTNENKLDKVQELVGDKLQAKIKEINDDIGKQTTQIQNLVGDKLQSKLNEINKDIGEHMDKIQSLVGEKLQNKFDDNMKKFSESVSENLRASKENFDSQFKKLYDIVSDRFKEFSAGSDKKLADINKTLEEKISALQTSNEKKLDDMKNIVDGKLQETLNQRITESFKLVNTHLSQVNEGIGEMKNLASDVGNLKKVLSNVKTRGTWGEIQLGSILEQILAPEQYETNFETKKGSGKRVEYVVKIPSNDKSKGENVIYLPIDSKFPLDTYVNLQDAYESADKNLMDKAKKDFISAIKSFAKDISTKYIDSVRTTDFAIMFLPSEGLYSEVVNTKGLLEELQNNHRINVAGPSTMAALLNSLYMSFRAFAIEKRSSEVWKILGAVKTEFNKFGEVIEKTQSRLEQATSELDKLVGTRTRQIKNKLKSVEEISIDEAENILPSKDLDLYVAENHNNNQD